MKKGGSIETVNPLRPMEKSIVSYWGKKERPQRKKCCVYWEGGGVRTSDPGLLFRIIG